MFLTSNQILVGRESIISHHNIFYPLSNSNQNQRGVQYNIAAIIFWIPLQWKLEIGLCFNISPPYFESPLHWELEIEQGFNNMSQLWYFLPTLQSVFEIGGGFKILPPYYQVFWTQSSIFYRGFNIPLRNIEARFIISHNVLNPDSIFCGIKNSKSQYIESCTSILGALVLEKKSF